ncbi:MAG: PocR ligand-binding domain-containing protein [Lachnospiraceae bacterium]
MERLQKNDLISEHTESLNIDKYLTGEDGGISKLNIIDLFGKEKLVNIQNSLSKATGLAFVTVDFRGEPITETTYFTSFCRCMREDPACYERCRSSDAFGAIQAAVTQTANVYFCPCGLLEVAIPIIVKGHYLGGFVGGQIRCTDAPATVSHLSSIMYSSKSEKIAKSYYHLLDEIPVYSYEKFLDIANLVFLVINQLGENEINQQMQEDILKKRIQKIQESNRRYIKDNSHMARQLKQLQIMTNPYHKLDMLTSLLNLSIMEEASQTYEMLSLYIEYEKYMHMDKETLVYLSGELEHAEHYLLFQKKKHGRRLEYSIQIPKEMRMHKIPSGVLLPFVQNAFYYGVMMKKEGGRIAIAGYIRHNSVVLEISDTGAGLSDEELDIKFEVYHDRHEGYYIRMGMDYARERLKFLYGEKFDIIIENHRNKGRKCVLIWPEYMEERTE